MATKNWTPICEVKDWSGAPNDIVIFKDDGMVAIGVTPSGSGKNPFVTDILTLSEVDFTNFILSMAKVLTPEPPNTQD